MGRITSGLLAFFAFGIVAPGVAGEPVELPVAGLLEAQLSLESNNGESDVLHSGRIPKPYDGTEIGAGIHLGSEIFWAKWRAAVRTMATNQHFHGRDTKSVSLGLPLSSWVVSSPFGMRADPFSSSSIANIGPAFAATRLPRAQRTGIDRVNVPTVRGIALGLSAKGTGPPASRTSRMVFMHEGVDFVAPFGAPVLAAGAGTVKGAAPNGGYGNWILIEHDGTELSTVYGHLASFAHGITPGTRVARGEVIGFVGNTGRTTGPHLHFELRVAGKPVNPMTHEAIKPEQFSPSDLAGLGLKTARSLMKQQAEKVRIDSQHRRSSEPEHAPYASESASRRSGAGIERPAATDAH